MAEAGKNMTRRRSTLRAPVCGECAHYHVSWDAALPYVCAAYGFKTRSKPSWVVSESSGVNCQLFRPAARRRPAARPKRVF